MLIAKNGKPFTFYGKKKGRSNCWPLDIFILSNLALCEKSLDIPALKFVLSHLRWKDQVVCDPLSL